jgi:FkbM family methyltransferase
MGARLEGRNDPETNGEYRLLSDVVASAAEGGVLLDVGANRGEWTARALRFARHAGQTLRVYPFEPAPKAYQYVRDRFASDPEVMPCQVAMSNGVETKALYVQGDVAGTNSLYPSGSVTSMVQVVASTVDRFLEQHSIDRVLMVKTDTEGHDFQVLLGAEGALRAGRIEVWQFEYNHLWISARRYLRDVFDFIAGKPYSVGRVHSRGIELYAKWHPELDRFFESNYVLVANDSKHIAACQRSDFDASNVARPLRRNHKQVS